MSLYRSFRIVLLFFVFFHTSFHLRGESIPTFYGPLEVTEPVLLELIKCPAMQRLKEVHQYGVAYYVTHKEEYNRFDHSIGVFAILRKNGAPLEEQIAGLLHDVSHTVFSHVGDWVFGKEYQEEDYQSMIYSMYLSHCGIEEILIKYGYTIHQIHPKNKQFAMLEQSLPNLCADRIDYNLQGAYFQNFLTKEEVLELYQDFRFVEGRWVATRADLLKKLVRFSLFMTQDCWGSAENYAISRWLADAMLKGLATGLLAWKEIHVGVDNEVWKKLAASQDPFIQQRMHMILHAKQYYKWVDPIEADIRIKFRCRGIDPWVLADGNVMRLTMLDSSLALELELVQKRASEGWPIQWVHQESENYFLR
jgi:hypothetical protein